MVLVTIPIPVTPNRYPISEVRDKSGSWWANATSTILNDIKGRIQIIRSLCTLIEEREDADAEETEQEGRSQERPDDAADFISRLSQEADIDCGHYGAYQG